MSAGIEWTPPVVEDEVRPLEGWPDVVDRAKVGSASEERSKDESALLAPQQKSSRHFLLRLLKLVNDPADAIYNLQGKHV